MNTENKYYKEAYSLLIEVFKSEGKSAHQISQTLAKPSTKKSIILLASTLEKLQTSSPALLEALKSNR